MPGINTAGLPAPSKITNTLPFTGTETFPVDSNGANGIAPQTYAMTINQMSTMGLGPVVAVTDAATIAVDCTLGSQFSVTIGATGRTLTMSSPSPGQEVVLYVKQDGTGSRTITTYTNVLWAAATAPTLTTTANATDVLRFTWNVTLGKWIGETVGKAFA
jgi:hypothetical protein